MQEKEVVRRLAGEILRGREAYPFGICRFADLPPLLECRAKQRLPENAQAFPPDGRTAHGVPLPNGPGAQHLPLCDGGRLPPDCRGISSALL